MKNKFVIHYLILSLLVVTIGSCQLFKTPIKLENKTTPLSYTNLKDSSNCAQIKWRTYFSDPNLIALIDTALKNNQELKITLQEIEIAKNEIRIRKGEYLPNGSIRGASGVDKSGKYTWNGLSEEDWKANSAKTPKYIGDFNVVANFSWELDIWKKLRNAKSAAIARYLGSVEGKNFMVTNLIAEIAQSYYELEALDNQLAIVQQNITIQENAFKIVKLQKESSKVTQLAVNRFEAQLLNTQNLQYDILQQIVETENKINFLTARFPVPIQRNANSFNGKVFEFYAAGVPSQLLENRPDIKQAEMNLIASKLDIKVAKASFFPNVTISAATGLQAFNPIAWLNPEAFLYNLSGDIVAPLINRNALIANFKTANAKQEQAVYAYEQTILKSYLEVLNQVSGIDNYSKSLTTKTKEVEILTQSISISDNLFKSARADYIEVLLTQKEALESKMQLIEIKKQQLSAEIKIYQALGGGWN